MKVSCLVVLPCRPLEVWTELAMWEEKKNNGEHRMVMVSMKQSGQWPYKCSHLQRGHLNNWMTSKAGRGRIGEKREIQ